jgi:hypothetical protein
MWFDNGRSIHGSNLQRLLFGNHQLKADMPSICIPVVQHKPLAALGLKYNGDSGPSAGTSTSTCRQSADALLADYGVSLDHRLMKADTMYALSELLEFCHNSEIQFLNAIENCVYDAIGDSGGREEASLETLVYCKRLLDEHIAYIHQTILFIDGPRNTSWRTAKDEVDIAVVEKILASMSGDYADTLERAKTIATCTLEGTEMLINASMLKESKKGISQAESTTRLSLLAVFFLPVNLVTSFFGMNFRQFGQGPLHIWIAFACMGIVLVLAGALLIIAKAKESAGAKKGKERIRTRWVRGLSNRY